MIDGVGLDRLEHRQFIHHLGRMRQQFTDPAPALASLVELEHRRGHRKTGLARSHGGDALTIAHRVRKILVEVLLQLRLVVPEIELGRSAIHVQIDEAHGLGREVRKTGQRRMHPRHRRSRSPQQLARPERGQRQTAEADTRIAEELTPGLIQLELEQRIHGQLRVTVSSRLSSRLAVRV